MAVNFGLLDSRNFRGAEVPVVDWSSGIARGLEQGLGNYMQGREKKQEKEEKERLLSLSEYEQAKDTFNIPAAEHDTQNVISAKQQAGNDLANEAADLTRKYRKGEITIDEYKQAEGALQQALTQVNNGDAYLNGVSVGFEKLANTPDSVSEASSVEALAVARGIKDKTVTMAWDKEMNKMVYTGTYADPATGEQVPIPNVPVGNENAFPLVVGKVEDPRKGLFNVNVQANKTLQDTAVKDGIEYTGTSWEDPQVQAAYNTHIDELLQDDNTMYSLATDYGIAGLDPLSREEVFAMESKDLRNMLKDRLMAQAQQQFFGNEKSRVSAAHTVARQEAQDRRAIGADARAQEAHDLRMQQIEQGGGQKGITANKAADIQAEEVRKQQDAALLQAAITPDEEGSLNNLQGLIGKGNIQNLEYDENTWSKGGKLEVFLKGNPDPIEFEVGPGGELPNSAKQLLQNQLNLGTVGFGEQTLNREDLKNKYLNKQ